MTKDFSEILNDWPYDPDNVTVRMIDGADGRPKLQMRLDLGVLQMELDGRPDGQEIHGFESWLEFYGDIQREHDAAHPDEARFLLDSDDCDKLLREGVQYYHRYISFWHLGKYELCARDTNRNLRLFRFVRDHAKHRRDKLQFEQYRPFVTMIHTRAVATPLIQLEDYDAALGAIDAGVSAIEQFLTEYQQSDRAGECSELRELKKWRKEVTKLARPPGSDGGPAAKRRPKRRRVSKLERLRRKLDDAVRNESYEEAADLRDQIAQLKERRAKKEN